MNAQVIIKNIYKRKGGESTQTCDSSFSSSTARCTIGPRTAYSTFFTVGFMVSMVNTLARDDTPFSLIFSLGSPRRVALTLDRALPGEEGITGGHVSARSPDTSPAPRPARHHSRRFPGDSVRAADMVNQNLPVTLNASDGVGPFASLRAHEHTDTRAHTRRSLGNGSCASEGAALLKILPTRAL